MSYKIYSTLYCLSDLETLNKIIYEIRNRKDSDNLIKRDHVSGD